tara:strand:+ start:1717 stop:2067 length:351 start_codon:yes stop_codon:yes gene_type:complete
MKLMIKLIYNKKYYNINMNIKFILLAIGLFLFTIGYVNQNKYNCNIIPSLEKQQEQNLRKLFNNNNVFLNRRTDNLLYTYNEEGVKVSATDIVGERNTGSIPAIPATPYSPPNNNR